MNDKNVMPERFYSLDTNMSIDKILRAQSTGEPLIGKVVLWNSNYNCLEVELGNNYRGYIPAKLASIYPVFSGELLSAGIRSLIGKPVVVSVINVIPGADGQEIILSRKDNMKKAFKFLSQSIGKEIECCITGFSSFGVYVDAGYGIAGLIHFKDLCLSRVRRFFDIGINVGDKITAKILYVNENFQVGLNYKDQFENLAFALNPGDILEVTVLNPINKEGYFAYLNPNTTAVVDVPEDVCCSYGDTVVAVVKGTRRNRPEQLKLTFISFI